MCVFCLVSYKKTPIVKKNIKARLEWAKKHYLWLNERWPSVVWGDKSKINFYESGGTKL